MQPSRGTRVEVMATGLGLTFSEPKKPFGWGADCFQDHKNRSSWPNSTLLPLFHDIIMTSTATVCHVCLVLPTKVLGVALAVCFAASMCTSNSCISLTFIVYQRPHLPFLSLSASRYLSPSSLSIIPTRANLKMLHHHLSDKLIRRLSAEHNATL